MKTPEPKALRAKLRAKTAECARLTAKLADAEVTQKLLEEAQAANRSLRQHLQAVLNEKQAAERIMVDYQRELTELRAKAAISPEPPGLKQKLRDWLKP